MRTGRFAAINKCEKTLRQKKKLEGRPILSNPRLPHNNLQSSTGTAGDLEYAGGGTSTCLQAIEDVLESNP
jgi:hypothetical protein